MKIRLLPAVSLMIGTLAAVPVLAQEAPQSRPGQERPGEGPRPMRVLPLQAALDANKDGEISAEEITNAAAALKTLDRNKDGKLSAEELRPVAPPVGPTVAELVARVMEFDANSDGKVTRDELPEQLATVFADADTNKDGIWTEAELTPFVEKQEAEAKAREAVRQPRLAPSGERGPGGPGGGTPRAMRVMPLQTALDANGDGEISAAEIANAAVALKTLDKNGDGKISTEEMRPARMSEPRPEGQNRQEH